MALLIYNPRPENHVVEIRPHPSRTENLIHHVPINHDALPRHCGKCEKNLAG